MKNSPWRASVIDEGLDVEYQKPLIIKFLAL